MPSSTNREKDYIILTVRGDDDDFAQLQKNCAEAGELNKSNFARERLGLKKVYFDKKTRKWTKEV